MKRRIKYLISLIFSLVFLTVSLLNGSLFTQVVKGEAINLDDYDLLDWEPVASSYWNSTDGVYYNRPISGDVSSATNFNYFLASGKMFTKNDIPNGSIIVVDSGYQYRPEGWINIEKQASRQNNVSTQMVVVDDTWWGNYNYRAFNLSSLTPNTVLHTNLEENAAHLKIYVPKQKQTFKVLAIGNSFSYDAMEHIYGIAEDCGLEDIILGHLYIGGTSLENHWNNASNNSANYTYYKNSTGTWTEEHNKTMLYGIKDEDWDVISLQQVSGLSGVESSYNTNLTNLVNYVNTNKTNPDAQLAWHMTWSYQSNSGHADFSRYNRNQLTMYNAITTATQNKIVANPDFDIIIPSGTAIQNVRTSYIGDTLTRDGYHLSMYLGRYIAGLTWVKAITGLPIEDLTYIPNKNEIKDDYLPIIIEAVNSAIEEPFKITNSTFTKPPVTYEFDNYDVLDWEPVPNAYWNSTDGNGKSTVLLSSANSSATNFGDFVSSARMFTKDDIPVGSLIVADPGYSYRPEGWVTLERQSSRPDLAAFGVMEVDEDWWGDYNYRAFNVMVVGNAADTIPHFRIYIPKETSTTESNEKDIIDFSINGVKGKIKDNSITVLLPYGTDVTALKASITISDKATISPNSNTSQDFTNPIEYTVIAENKTTKTYTVTVTLSDSENPKTDDANISLLFILVGLSLIAFLTKLAKLNFRLDTK